MQPEVSCLAAPAAGAGHIGLLKANRQDAYAFCEVSQSWSVLYKFALVPMHHWTNRWVWRGLGYAHHAGGPRRWPCCTKVENRARKSGSNIRKNHLPRRRSLLFCARNESMSYSNHYNLATRLETIPTQTPTTSTTFRLGHHNRLFLHFFRTSTHSQANFRVRSFFFPFFSFPHWRCPGAGDEAFLARPPTAEGQSRHWQQ